MILASASLIYRGFVGFSLPSVPKLGALEGALLVRKGFCGWAADGAPPPFMFWTITRHRMRRELLAFIS